MKEFTDNGAAAVDRAVAILKAFGADDRWLGLSEVSRRTGLYKSTVLRLVNSLMAAGLLVRGDDGYRIGPEALRLGSIYERGYDLRETIVPILRALSRKVEETCSLYVRERDHRVCLHRVEPDRRLKMQIKPGDALPLDRGAGGRVLSAFAGMTGETMDIIRAERFYVSRGELDTETAGLAAPVFGPAASVLGAIVITAPSVRLDERSLSRWREQLLISAEEATNALGGGW